MPFRKCRTEIDDTFIDEAEYIITAMPMYNLTECSDNYSDTLRSLWQFKRDEMAENLNLTVDNNHIPDNSLSFKYRVSLITNRNDVKIAVPLKYLSNVWRSLEMPLINCKVELSFIWDPNCVLYSLAEASTFTITDEKLYVPIITLPTENNAKLSKILSEIFIILVYWNAYKVISEKSYDTNTSIREWIDSSCQEIKRLFALAFEGGANVVTVNSHRRILLLHE